MVKDLGAHDWAWDMLSIRADNVEFTLVGLSDSELGKRSEERRVGKEC